MGETPDDIREEIEETRARMGDTVEAIGYKADVKSRVSDSIADKKDAVVGKADALVARVGGVVPGSDQVKHGAAKVGVGKENPVGLAIVGAAAGFIAGTLLPKTTIEDEKLGHASDQVTDTVKEAGQEALERGKSVVEDAVHAATDTVQERGQHEAEAMTDSLRDKAQQVAGTTN
jgi:hypothetical protein